MNVLRAAACAACVLGLLAAAAAAAAAEDKAGIEGRYVIVKGESDGKPLPADKVKGSTLVITKDKVMATDKDTKEFFSATYTLDTSKKPWSIKMVGITPKKGETADGIVAADGDTLKICYALPGGETPKDFTTKDKQNCFVLKREDKKEK